MQTNNEFSYGKKRKIEEKIKLKYKKNKKSKIPQRKKKIDKKKTHKEKHTIKKESKEEKRSLLTCLVGEVDLLRVIFLDSFTPFILGSLKIVA